MGKICVIGSLNMDLIVRVERLPEAGETVGQGQFHTVPGGKGANQALAAARSGGEVQMLGSVGTDEFGKTLVQNLATAGVETELIRIVTNIPTGMAVILLEKGGGNRIIVIPGANDSTDVDFLNQTWHQVERGSILLLQHEIPAETNQWIMEKAAESDCRVFLNPSPYAPLTNAMLARVDTLFVNEIEAEKMSGNKVESADTAITAAELILNSGVQAVIVTLGSEGAVYCDGVETLYQPVFDVVPVDTTGAGDTFIGAYAASVSAGQTIREALQYASAAAALSVSRLGAQSSIPIRSEVEQFLKASKSLSKNPEYSNSK